MDFDYLLKVPTKKYRGGPRPLHIAVYAGATPLDLEGLDHKVVHSAREVPSVIETAREQGRPVNLIFSRTERERVLDGSHEMAKPIAEAYDHLRETVPELRDSALEGVCRTTIGQYKRSQGLQRTA